MNPIRTLAKSRETGPRTQTPRILFLVGAGVLILSGCGKPREGHPAPGVALPAAPVRIQTVEVRNLPVVEEVVGTVRPRLRATLEAKLSGRIDKLPVALGQPVKRGELVGRLDTPEIKARFDQAEASLQQAERDWKRVSSLFNQHAATRADFDAADSRYLVAKAAVAEARAMLDYVEIVAPFDGVVTRKWVDVGDLALPGKALVDLEDPTTLQFEADVPEALISRIHRDTPMPLRVDSVAGDLTGTVAEVAPSADAASRTFRVKVNLPENPALKSGQFGRLQVPVGESACVSVPASAIVQRGQMEIVFTVEEQRAKLHLVKSGRRIGPRTEILSGLDEKDSVVVEGAAQLVDGQPVEVK